MAVLLDILEPLSEVSPAVMLFIGGLSREYRAAALSFWHLRHDAYCRGDFVRGKAVTRVLAERVGGTKRKRCQGCGDALALPWPFEPTIHVCNGCTKRGGPPEFRLISATEATSRFGLATVDLWKLDQFHTSTAKLVDGEPFLAGRVMFRTLDVLLLTMSKYG